MTRQATKWKISGPKINLKMPDITCNLRNVNPNHSEIPVYTYQTGKSKGARLPQVMAGPHERRTAAHCWWKANRSNHSAKPWTPLNPRARRSNLQRSHSRGITPRESPPGKPGPRGQEVRTGCPSSGRDAVERGLPWGSSG